MINRSDYPDLSKPLPQFQNQGNDYPDLSKPISQVQPQPSKMQDILSYAKNLLPSPPTSLPLGVNVVSGVLSSVVPQEQKNAIAQLPQIATNTNYGLPQKVAAGIGQNVPSLLGGGESLLGQTASGAAQGAIQAPWGQKLHEATQNALLTGTLGSVLPGISTLFRSNPSEGLTSTIQNVHDALDNKAAQGFEDVRQGVNDRGITQVPMTLSSMKDISNVFDEGYLPKTPQAKQLVSKAIQGDFNALRDLQTSLWQKGTKAASANDIIQNNKADEIFDLRDRINQNISDHLVNTGNDDLNNLLNQSRNDYLTLQNTFYNKKLPVSIRKLVSPDTREIPNDIGKIMQKNSIPMNNLKNALVQRPFLNEKWLGNPVSNVNSDIAAYNLRKGVGPLIKILGVGGFGLGEAATLYEMMKNSRPHSNLIQ